MTSSESASGPSHGRAVRGALPTLAAIVLVPVLAMLGFWQLDRAGQQLEVQQRIARLAELPALEVPNRIVEESALADSRVVARGAYDPAHQFLLDNQVHDGQPGYHVFTPLLRHDGDTAILVNRGWVPWNTDRWQLPEIATPGGVIEVEGRAYAPPRRYFTLQRTGAQDSEAQAVRQHLDMQRIALRLPYPVQPVVILLDPDSPAGGFVRVWPAGDLSRVARHRAYAVQWFALAGVVVVIWIALTRKNRKTG